MNDILNCFVIATKITSLIIIIRYSYFNSHIFRRGPFDITNLKHLIDHSKERILLIDQSKKFFEAFVALNGP